MENDYSFQRKKLKIIADLEELKVKITADLEWIRYEERILEIKMSKFPYRD